MPPLITVIAGLLDPQENSMMPEEPATTELTFATKAVELVPQFAVRTEGGSWSPCTELTMDPKAASSSDKMRTQFLGVDMF